MNTAPILLLALIVLTQARTLTHEQISQLACCPQGMVFDQHILRCICPAGTSPTGPSKICCPANTIATPSGTCECSAPMIYDNTTKQCKCPFNQVEDPTTKQCKCPPNLQYVDATGKCVDCPAPGKWNLNNKTCMACPTGFEIDTNTWLCSCPKDKPILTKLKTCTSCPEPQYWN